MRTSAGYGALTVRLCGVFVAKPGTHLFQIGVSKAISRTTTIDEPRFSLRPEMSGLRRSGIDLSSQIAQAELRARKAGLAAKLQSGAGHLASTKTLQ